MRGWLLIPLAGGAMLLASASPWWRHAAHKAPEPRWVAAATPQEALSAPAPKGAVKATAPASSPLALGSADGDLVYTRISPCRIVDTRAAGGRLPPGVARHLQAAASSFSSQGGSNSDCAVLEDASVVVLNIVVVNPDNPGFLTAYAYGDARPGTSSLNYDRGDLLANEVTVKTARGANFDFSVFSTQGADVVIDVAGYFAPPAATEVDCETSYGNWVSLAQDGYGRSRAVCASALQTRAAGGCNWDHVNLQLVQYGQLVGHPDAQGGFTCDGDNPVATTLRFRANVVCCGVPGR